MTTIVRNVSRRQAVRLATLLHDASRPSAVRERMQFIASNPALVQRRQGFSSVPRGIGQSLHKPLAAQTISSRKYATHAQPNVNQPRQETIETQDLESSVDAIVPDSLFAEQAPSPSSSSQQDATMPSRSAARSAVATVLQQLRESVDAKSRQEAVQLESQANEDVRAQMQAQDVSANSLHHFGIALLKHSRDPRRMPIASRLFVAAFGLDPMSLPDPTAPEKTKEFPTRGVDESLAGIALAGKDAWAVNAAGYNWASMVLSGQAAPPAGLHLLKRGSSEVRELITEQQAAAIRIYATLAMRGDAQGMLGMGRILIAGMHRQSSGGAQVDEAKQKQSTMMRDRALALWTRAGEKGVSEAWFELGLLTLSSAEAQPTNPADTNANNTALAEAQARATSYFERGAKAGNARSHHALGVLLTQRAMQNNETPAPAERGENLQKSMEHFRQAATMGDGESAHHMGMRFLLRQELLEEIGLGSEQDGRSQEDVRSQAIDRHEKLWGVQPNDVEAREWFSKGSDAGYMPAMMNFAGMLVEQRGQDSSAAATAAQESVTLRMQELRKAESLYAKVAATASAMSQQGAGGDGGGGTASQEQQADGGSVSMGHMASFAQEALGKVRDELKQVAEAGAATVKAST